MPSRSMWVDCVFGSLTRKRLHRWHRLRPPLRSRYGTALVPVPVAYTTYTTAAQVQIIRFYGHLWTPMDTSQTWSFVPFNFPRPPFWVGISWPKLPASFCHQCFVATQGLHSCTHHRQKLRLGGKPSHEKFGSLWGNMCPFGSVKFGQILSDPPKRSIWVCLKMGYIFPMK